MDWHSPGLKPDIAPAEKKETAANRAHTNEEYAGNTAFQNEDIQ
jgi:hypothetical protein